MTRKVSALNCILKMSALNLSHKIIALWAGNIGKYSALCIIIIIIIIYPTDSILSV